MVTGGHYGHTEMHNAYLTSLAIRRARSYGIKCGLLCMTKKWLLRCPLMSEFEDDSEEDDEDDSVSVGEYDIGKVRVWDLTKASVRKLLGQLN